MDYSWVGRGGGLRIGATLALAFAASRLVQRSMGLFTKRPVPAGYHPANDRGEDAALLDAYSDWGA